MTAASPLPSLSFRIVSAVSQNPLSPRLGIAQLSRSSSDVLQLPTPGLILHTSRGIVPHLSRDHVSKLAPYMPWLHVSFESFLETDPPIPTLQPGGAPLHTLLGLPPSKHIISVSLRDPADLQERPSNGDKYVTAISVRGVKKVDPGQYRAYMSLVSPDLIVAVPDIPFTPPPYSQKRITKSLDRTMRWLSDQIRDRLQDSDIQLGASSSNILVSMVGGASLAARQIFAEGLLGPLEGEGSLNPAGNPRLARIDDAIAGYVIELASLKSSMSASLPRNASAATGANDIDSLIPLVQGSLSALPCAKPRLVHTVASPMETLHLILFAGIDLFDSHWAQQAADWGIALDFSFPVPSYGVKAPLRRQDNKRDVGYNLYDHLYAYDFSPLLAEQDDSADILRRCHCLACSPVFGPPIRHSVVDEDSVTSEGEAAPSATRAYLHHLLHTHEMSAHALLASHNLITLELFFSGVRHVLQSDAASFPAEVARFEAEYDESMSILAEGRRDWQRVDLARGKGRLARERAANAVGTATDIEAHVADELLGEQVVAYLRTLPSIRERSSRVFRLAQAGRLEYFDYHPEKENDVRDYCIALIKRDYGTDYQSIPPHGRWRHFDVGGRPRIDHLIDSWKATNHPVDDSEICKRLLDLFLISVLLDAGAGNAWKYKENSSGDAYTRSEGLAIASLDLFCSGLLSTEEGQPYRVDSAGLFHVSPESLAYAMQADPISNPLVGVEGRAGLLSSLGSALSLRPDFFGKAGRPGDMLDYFKTQTRTESGRTYVHVAALWNVVMEGLNPIWPQSRTKLNGVSMGDVWSCNALALALSENGGKMSPGEELVPFHKLSQWLTYSLIEVLQKIMNWTVEGIEDMTGLPEYRNGGLLMDLGVLSLRANAFPTTRSQRILSLPTSHPAIVEWRAMTVIGLDRVAEAIRSSLGLSSSQLTLTQVLESATWKGGREIAKSKRPATGGPPLEIESDGTLF